MNAAILNREFQHPADHWYMIEPRGDHANRAAGLVQVIDAEAGASIVNRFNADAAAGQLSHGTEMLIDHEHFKHDQDKETRAYGWLTRLENRDDGIYGQVRWTNTGKAAVDGGDYRFFSTEYDPRDVKILNDGKVKRVRPLRLDGLTLTNNPNNKGGRPITNRGGEKTDLRGAAVAAPAEPQTKGKPMKSVCTLLGLSEDAQESSVLEAVTRLKNRADISPADAQKLRDENTALKSENKTLIANRVEADLESYKDCYKAEERETVKADLIANREITVRGFERVRSTAKAAPTPAGQRMVLNRADGKAPAPARASHGEADAATAEKITNRASELVAGGMKFERAWNQASREVAAKQ